MMQYTAYLAINYWKWVHNYFGRTECNIFYVLRSDSFGIFT